MSITAGTPPHLTAAALARALEDDLVYVGAVQVFGDLTAALAQLLARAGAEALLAVGLTALPDRQRRAPVAIARERPVHVVLKPLAEAPVPDVLGVPADPLVLGQHPVLDLGGGDVPARLRVVEERGVAAPAVRVGVQIGLGPEHLPGGLQRRDYVGVGLLDLAAGEVGDPLVERALKRDRVLQRDPVLLAEPEVVLAEGDGGVDEPRAVLGGDEVPQQDRVAAGAIVADVAEGRLVARARQGLAREVGEDLAPSPRTASTRSRARTKTSPGPPSRPRGPARTRSRPPPRPRRSRSGSGRGRPDQQQVAGLQRRLWDLVGRRDFPDRQLHVDGEVLDVVVAEGDLVRAERVPQRGQ